MVPRFIRRKTCIDLYSIQNVLYEIEDDTFRTTPRSKNQVTVSLGPCERKKEPRNSLCPRGYCSANACQDRNRSNSVKLSREAENFDNLLHNHLSMFLCVRPKNLQETLCGLCEAQPIITCLTNRLIKSNK
jgi:hypothetical protein